MGKQFAHLDAAPSIFLELEGRPKSRARLPLRLQIEGQRFAMPPVERRYRIKRIDLRRPAIGEDVNHTLRLRGEMRRAGRERIVQVDPDAWDLGARRARGQHGCETKRTEPDAAPIQEIATGEETILEARSVGHGLKGGQIS